jgi:hypothetical protein
MQESEPLDAAEERVADALRTLRPTARTAARQVWYQAGFQAGRRRMLAWQAASLTAATIAIAVGAWRFSPSTLPMAYIAPTGVKLSAATRPGNLVRRTEEPPAVDLGRAAQIVWTFSGNYWTQRDLLAQRGLDALGPNPSDGQRHTLARAGMSFQEIERFSLH